MTDRFQNSSPSLAGPASHAYAVTPSDSVPLPEATRGLYVGSGGSIAATMLSGESVTFAAVPSGSTLPLRLTRIHASGTTAADIVALI